MTGASRTDAGVHALGQTVALTAASSFPAATVRPPSTPTCPREIRVVSAGGGAERASTSPLRARQALSLLIDNAAAWPPRCCCAMRGTCPAGSIWPTCGRPWPRCTVDTTSARSAPRRDARPSPPVASGRCACGRASRWSPSSSRPIASCTTWSVTSSAAPSRSAEAPGRRTGWARSWPGRSGPGRPHRARAGPHVAARDVLDRGGRRSRARPARAPVAGRPARERPARVEELHAYPPKVQDTWRRSRARSSASSR